MSRVDDYMAQATSKKEAPKPTRSKKRGRKRARFALAYLAMMAIIAILVLFVGESVSILTLLVHTPFAVFLPIPIVGVLWALYRKNLRGLFYSVASIGIAIFLMRPVIGRSPDEPTSPIFSVMTLNLQDVNEGDQKAADAIREFTPDVILLQEVTTLKSRKELRKTIVEGYESFFLTENLAIISRYPVDELREIRFHELFKLDKPENLEKYGMVKPHHNWGQIAKVRFGQQHVYVINTHLSPITYSPEPLGLFDMLRLISKKNAYRMAQIDELKKQIERLKGPVILGGDLNTVPIGKAYDALTENLEDSWNSVGSGFGWTISAKTPYGRLDYLLSNNFWKPARATVGNLIGSDHRSYLAGFELVKPWKLEKSQPTADEPILMDDDGNPVAPKKAKAPEPAPAAKPQSAKAKETSTSE